MNKMRASIAYRMPGQAESSLGESLSKSQRFRDLLSSPDLSFFMEAHNGMSARIVEEAGFEGIWASGLSISTAFGVRDRGEASWTQVLDVLEFMSDATSIPILVDADTGFGDFNVFRRVVKKLCQRSIAAVCIEDQTFPKTNSLLDANQSLADIDEFCGKIRAGKDSQTDDSFSIIARIEALIAGRGMDEALRRAEAYHRAGADGILIHSRKPVPEEILFFAKEWANRAPLVIVPTTYWRTPTQAYRDAAISLVIWANHNLRASLAAIRDVSARIRRDESLDGVESNVASLSDVFALTGSAELVEAEKRYLTQGQPRPSAIVLAASRGEALGELTADRPKCMLDVRGEPILNRLVRTMQGRGISNITVVAGYQPAAIDLVTIRKVLNPAFDREGEVSSLAVAAERLADPCIIAYGDIIIRDHVLDALLDTNGDIVVVIDAMPEKSAIERKIDWVQCSAPCSAELLVHNQPVELLNIGAPLPLEGAHGQWIGLLQLSRAGAAMVRRELEAMRQDGTLEQASMANLLSRLIAAGAKPQAVYIQGGWLDVNDAFGLAQARNFL